ncbi:MAG: hypothetical protein GY773_00930 [Actinomycetia bacterium]|nr:hypothetical protein [Actinomycetes bacterium]
MVEVWPGKRARLFVTMRYEDGRLSISGVEGPKVNGDAVGSCGQCRDALVRLYSLERGWTRAMAGELHTIWDRWHLNDMRAGTLAQESHLRTFDDWRADATARSIMGDYGPDHYLWAQTVLAEVNLQPDPNGPDGPYSYGSAWLSEDVPADILESLAAMPRATRSHPWGRHG